MQRTMNRRVKMLGVSAIVLGALIAAAAVLASVAAEDWAEPRVESLTVKQGGIEVTWSASGYTSGLVGSEIGRSLTGNANDWQTVAEVEAGTYTYLDEMDGVDLVNRDSGSVWHYRVRLTQRGPTGAPTIGEWSNARSATVPSISPPVYPFASKLNELGYMWLVWTEHNPSWSSDTLVVDGYAMLRSVHEPGTSPHTGVVSVIARVPPHHINHPFQVEWPEQRRLRLTYKVVSFSGVWFSATDTLPWFPVPNRLRPN